MDHPTNWLFLQGLERDTGRAQCLETCGVGVSCELKLKVSDGTAGFPGPSEAMGSPLCPQDPHGICSFPHLTASNSAGTAVSAPASGLNPVPPYSGLHPAALSPPTLHTHFLLWLHKGWLVQKATGLQGAPEERESGKSQGLPQALTTC